MSTALLRDTEMVFGRHQTFTPRYTWLKSSYDAVAANPLLFTTPDAHRVLGVGKNMARSIRFWLQAAGVAHETSSRHMVPTAFGRFLMAADGADPYLESDAAWWLLHWRFVGPRGQLPVWWIAFHAFQPSSFTVDTLTEHAATHLEAIGESAPEKTLRRDVLAMVRNYVGDPASSRTKADDTIDVPFAHLNVMREADDGTFRFVTGPKRGLEPEVVLYSALDFLAAVQDRGSQPLIGRLALEAGGPGRAFRLTERDLSGLLREAAEADDAVHVRTVGGADQLILDGPHNDIAIAALWRMFRRLGVAEATEPPAIKEDLLRFGMAKLFDTDEDEGEDR